MEVTFRFTLDEFDAINQRGWELCAKMISIVGELASNLASDKNFVAIAKKLGKKPDHSLPPKPRKKRVPVEKPKRTRISKKEKEAALTELAAEKKPKV